MAATVRSISSCVLKKCGDTRRLRSARPLVTAAAVEVGFDVAEIDVDQAERLRTIEVAQHTALARDPADFLGRKEIAVRGRDVSDRDEPGARRNGFGDRVDMIVGARMRIIM